MLVLQSIFAINALSMEPSSICYNFKHVTGLKIWQLCHKVFKISRAWELFGRIWPHDILAYWLAESSIWPVWGCISTSSLLHQNTFASKGIPETFLHFRLVLKRVFIILKQVLYISIKLDFLNFNYWDFFLLVSVLKVSCLLLWHCHELV